MEMLEMDKIAPVAVVAVVVTYMPGVQSQPVAERTARRWSQEAEETTGGLWGYRGGCTVHGDDISGLVECVADNMENTIPSC